MIKISITYALSELKLLDARINKVITKNNVGNSTFCIAYIAESKIGGTMTPEEAETAIKSNYQSVKDLIKYRASIKAAIVKSNAETEVEINGIKMTVAEAIEYKSSIIYDQMLLSTLKSEYRNASALITQGNEQARAKAQASLDNILGKDSNKKPTKEDIASIYDPVYNRYEWKMQDPIGIAKKIEELETAIDGFLNDVNIVLSTSNALTMIEVDKN